MAACGAAFYKWDPQIKNAALGFVYKSNPIPAHIISLHNGLLFFGTVFSSSEALIYHRQCSPPHPQTKNRFISSSSTNKKPICQPPHLRHWSSRSIILYPIHHPPHPFRSRTHLCRSRRCLPQPIAFLDLSYHSILSLFFFLFKFFLQWFLRYDLCSRLTG